MHIQRQVYGCKLFVFTNIVTQNRHLELDRGMINCKLFVACTLGIHSLQTHHNVTRNSLSVALKLYNSD